MKPQSAFTLVELSIVLVILGLQRIFTKALSAHSWPG